MNAQIESLIEYYLSRNGKNNIFLCPQFHVDHDRSLNEGGACPDFVALDFRKKKIIVVEVSVASSISKLRDRINNREKHWFNPIMRRFIADRIIPDPAVTEGVNHWGPRFIGFVRLKEAAVDRIARTFENNQDVTFVDIESALLAYDYWNKELP